MTVYKFALSATSLASEERLFAKLAPELHPKAVRAKLGTPEFFEAVLAQEHALKVLRMEEQQNNAQLLHIGKRAVVHRYRRL